MKWVGGLTAVLSLVFGLVQLSEQVFGYRERRRHVEVLLSTGRLQRDAHDFAAAWASDSQAGQLGGDNAAVGTAQEDLAMAWLDDAHLKEAESFASFSERLTPVLQRGLLDAQGMRKGDLLAHLGWAQFLRSRDGIGGLQSPESFYRQALAADPNNVYAHTMWGHWILWHTDSLDEAQAHFAAALAGGRERGYVRRMQLAALDNSHDDAAGEALIRVAHDMYVHHDSVDEQTRGRLSSVYFFRLSSGDEPSLHRLLAVLPPSDHLETLQWLFGKEDGENVTRAYIRALLQEAAGSRADALHTMKSLRARSGLDPRLQSGIAAAIKRLSQSQ